MKKFKALLIVILCVNVALAVVSFGLNWLASYQHPPEGKFVDLGNITTHVIEAPVNANDSSTAVVLVHGANTSALDFDNNLLPSLSERYNVIAIDRPGHGYSERGQAENMHDPTVQALVILDTLAALGINRPVLIGHSWAGSLVMAALLVDHDVEPRAGVLIAGVTHPWDYKDSHITSTALAPVRGLFFRYQYLPIAGRLAIPSTVERALAPDPVPANYIEDTGLYLSLRPSYLYNAQDRSNLSEHLASLTRQYDQIDKPIFSIAGSGDTIVPPEHHHTRLTTELVTVDGVLIEGAGHAPHHTRRDEVVKLLFDFIDRLPETDL